MEMQQTSSEVLKKEILDQSKTESESILAEARKEETRLLNQARKEAAAIKEKILKSTQLQAKAIEKKILSSVQLEIKKQKLNSREQIFTRIMQSVKERLKEYRSNPKYPSFIEASLYEAVQVLQEDKLVVETGEIEKKILEKGLLKKIMQGIQKQNKHTVTISLSKNLLDEGGILVFTTDGRKRYDNSFSAQIRRHEDAMRLSILRNVFGK